VPMFSSEPRRRALIPCGICCPQSEAANGKPTGRSTSPETSFGPQPGAHTLRLWCCRRSHDATLAQSTGGLTYFFSLIIYYVMRASWTIQPCRPGGVLLGGRACEREVFPTSDITSSIPEFAGGLGEVGDALKDRPFHTLMKSNVIQSWIAGANDRTRPDPPARELAARQTDRCGPRRVTSIRNCARPGPPNRSYEERGTCRDQFGAPPFFPFTHCQWPRARGPGPEGSINQASSHRYSPSDWRVP